MRDQPDDQNADWRDSTANTPKVGPVRRLVIALVNSFDGLAVAWKGEVSFRQEVALVVVLSAAALALPLDGLLKLVLILMHLAVLVVELLNTGIEAIVDKACPERHELAKKAKDTGSAAVLIALIAGVAAWGYAIFTLVAPGASVP